MIGLVAPEGPDADDTDAAPTLFIGDGLLDDAQASAISDALVAVGAAGTHGDVSSIPAPESLGVDVVVAVGLGSADDVENPEKLRQAAGIAARALAGRRQVTTTLAAGGIEPVAEGFFLGAYRFDEFRSATVSYTHLTLPTIYSV